MITNEFKNIAQNLLAKLDFGEITESEFNSLAHQDLFLLNIPEENTLAAVKIIAANDGTEGSGYIGHLVKKSESVKPDDGPYGYSHTIKNNNPRDPLGDIDVYSLGGNTPRANGPAFEYFKSQFTSAVQVKLEQDKKKAIDLLMLKAYLPEKDTVNPASLFAWQSWYSTVRAVFTDLSKKLPDDKLEAMVKSVAELGVWVNSD